jgi:hypothetical protein
MNIDFLRKQLSDGIITLTKDITVNKNSRIEQFSSASEREQLKDLGLNHQGLRVLSLDKAQFFNLNVSAMLFFDVEKIKHISIVWLDGKCHQLGYEMDIDDLPKEKKYLSKKCEQFLGIKPISQSEWSDRFVTNWGSVYASAEPISVTCGISLVFN